MIGVIVVTHGQLANELVNATSHRRGPSAVCRRVDRLARRSGAREAIRRRSIACRDRPAC